MRVGLIGGGRIGAVHAATLAALPGVDRLSIADQVPSVATELADRVGADSAPVDDLFGSVDGLVIASPTDTHVTYLHRASEAGLPTFCEKPIAIGLPETDSAIEAIRAAGITVQMGLMRRFDPGYLRAHDLVSSGAMGELLLVTSHTHDPEPPPEAYVERSGGVFKDMLVHDIDVLRFVTGQEIVEVLATGSNRTMEWFDRYDDLATVAVAAHLTDRTMAILSGSRRDPVGYDVRMEVFGTGDSVAVGLDPHTPIRSVEPEAPTPADHVDTGWLARFGTAFRAEMEAFLGVIGGGPSPCTPEDAREALAVAEACIVSVRERRWVRVEECR